jgi:hypothetical protein
MYVPKHTLIGVLMIVLVSGCAASRALNEPSKKNYDVLRPGTNRDLVRAELGDPLKSVARDECDVFSFQEGSSGWKYLRAMGYSILDIGTLGISEVVTNPVEASVGKDKVRLRVCYDAIQDVAYSEKLEVGKPPVLMTGAYPPAPPATVSATPVAAPVAAATTDPAGVNVAAPADAPAPGASVPAGSTSAPAISPGAAPTSLPASPSGT